MTLQKLRTGEGGGVKNPENVAYVLYGWPLTLFVVKFTNGVVVFNPKIKFSKVTNFKLKMSSTNIHVNTRQEYNHQSWWLSCNAKKKMSLFLYMSFTDIYDWFAWDFLLLISCSVSSRLPTYLYVFHWSDPFLSTVYLFLSALSTSKIRLFFIFAWLDVIM